MPEESTTPDLVELTRGLFEAADRRDFDAIGNGVILTVVIQTARPVGSSGEVRLRYAMVGAWTESLIVSLTNYGDIDEARAAAERLAEERG
jgi:hypothetical protein